MKKSWSSCDLSAPKISFDGYERIIEIEGNFNMLSCNALLNEIIEGISELGANSDSFQVIIGLNSINAKCIVGLVSFLKTVSSAYPVEVVWRHRYWDIDHLELGETIKSILGVPFRMEEIDY